MDSKRSYTAGTTEPPQSSGRVTPTKPSETGEQKFRDILLQSPGGFCILQGPDMVIDFANKPMLVSWKKDWDVIGKPLLEVLPEIKGQAFPQLLQKVYTTGETYYGYEEKAVLIENGIPVDTYYTYVYQPVMETDGTISGITVMALDVTVQVAAGKKIEVSESQYGLLIDSVHDYGMFMTDLQGMIKSWNPGIERILGYNENEFVGKNTAIIFTAEDKGTLQHEKEMESALKNGRTDDIRWHLKKDGSRFFAEGVMTLMKDDSGQPVGFAKIFKDITSRQKAEEALKEAQNESLHQKRLYEAVTSNTPDLIYVFDLDYRFTYANQALLAMWGKSWDNAIGKGLLENGYEPWHAEMHEREIDQVVATKQPVRGEVSFPHATLGRRVYDYLFVPVINGEGNVEAVAGTTRDITELKNAEEALKQSREKLEALIIERTQELQRSNKELQVINEVLAEANAAFIKSNQELSRSNQNLEEFAHAASHDLKEPVRKIQFFTSKLKSQLTSQIAEDEVKTFEKIEQATMRMGNLIDDLLLYSHVSERPLQMEQINLNLKLQQVLDILELEIQQKGAAIQIGDLPVVKGYRRQLSQLFQNLIGNALKYGKEGLAPVIDVTAAITNVEGQPYNVIEIKDNGIGFQQEYADRIFQMFTRLHGKNEYGGTGVGLSIAKKVAENHNGFIKAESTPGEGSIFKVYLPCS